MDIHKIYNTIATIPFSTLDNILNVLFNQTCLCEIEVLYSSTYKINLDNLQIEKIISDSIMDYDEWKIIIQKVDGSTISVDILEQDTLIKWLNDNISIRYLSIPVTIVDDKTDYNHSCMLIIDKSLNEVYFYDPNGQSVLESVNDDIIDKFFKLYFDDSIGLNYISSDVFNNKKICINIQCDNEDYGNCIITSILLPHYLYLSDKTIYEGIEYFDKLSNKELENLIKNCMMMIYDLIEN
jgi:hypothetical protein